MKISFSFNSIKKSYQNLHVQMIIVVNFSTNIFASNCKDRAAKSSHCYKTLLLGGQTEQEKLVSCI